MFVSSERVGLSCVLGEAAAGFGSFPKPGGFIAAKATSIAAANRNAGLDPITKFPFGSQTNGCARMRT